MPNSMIIRVKVEITSDSTHSADVTLFHLIQPSHERLHMPAGAPAAAAEIGWLPKIDPGTPKGRARTRDDAFSPAVLSYIGACMDLTQEIH